MKSFLRSLRLRLFGPRSVEQVQATVRDAVQDLSDGIEHHAAEQSWHKQEAALHEIAAKHHAEAAVTKRELRADLARTLF